MHNWWHARARCRPPAAGTGADTSVTTTRDKPHGRARSPGAVFLATISAAHARSFPGFRSTRADGGRDSSGHCTRPFVAPSPRPITAPTPGFLLHTAYCPPPTTFTLVVAEVAVAFGAAGVEVGQQFLKFLFVGFRASSPASVAISLLRSIDSLANFSHCFCSAALVLALSLGLCRP